MAIDAFIKFKQEMARRSLVIKDKIGEGGMGSVYEAFDEALERRAAVKIMRSDAGNEAWRERFRREAKFAAKIVHPGVAQVYQAGELEGLLYYVMEFVDGQPLSAFLKKARFISAHEADVPVLLETGYLKPPDPAAPYFLRDLIAPPLSDPSYLSCVDELIASIADILAAVHTLESVHRDIKPSNIMITSDGRVKLVDFGLVKQAVDRDLTLAGQFVGTFDYMAPEQFRGRNSQVSPASDIYSLGVVYYELATLVKPFEGDGPAALIGAITANQPPDPRALNYKVNAARSAVILKCIAKEPSGRFASAGELAAAVRNLKCSQAGGFVDGLKSFFYGLFSSGAEEAGGRESDLRGGRPAPSGETRRETSAGPVPEIKTSAGAGVPAAADGRAVSRKLFEEAREEYFRNFVTPAVQEKLKQSFDLDPLNADALLLFFMFLNHGIITRPEFDLKLAATREGEGALDAREKLILEAITGMYSRDDVKSASAAGFRYANLYPDDLLMTVFVSMTEMMQCNFGRALECCDKVTARYGDFLLMHLIKSDIYAATGDIARSVAIDEEVMARDPGSANNRFLLIQKLLLYGLVEDAEWRIAEAAAAGGDQNDSINYQRSVYYLCRGMIKESVLETKKLIALEENPLFKAYHYYRLYRIKAFAGEPGRAAEYLAMANKLIPDLKFKDFDSIREDINKLPLDAMKPETIPPGAFGPALEFSRRICFKTLDPLTYGKLSTLGETAYYHLEPQQDGDAMGCERAIIYSDYHFKSSPATKSKICMESVPVSPFVSHTGDNLAATVKKFPSPNGDYYAHVVYSTPQKNGEPMFFMAQFEPVSFPRDGRTGRFSVRLSGKPNSNASHAGFVISFPEGYRAVSASPEPDEKAEMSGRTYYYYTKFLFCGQRFGIELELAPVKAETFAKENAPGNRNHKEKKGKRK